MKLRHIGYMGGLIGLAFFGCEDPGAIVPTTPPGANIPRESPDHRARPGAGRNGRRRSPSTPNKAELAKNFPLAPATAKGEKKKTKRGVEYETITPGAGPELHRVRRPRSITKGRSPTARSSTRLAPSSPGSSRSESTR